MFPQKPLVHTYNYFRKSNSTVKGRLSKMKTEVLGSGPMEGSPEPDMDQANSSLTNSNTNQLLSTSAYSLFTIFVLPK